MTIHAHACCCKIRSYRPCAGLLKMANRAVAIMRRPAMRRRLQSELGALPQPAMSYDELLAFFVDYGRRQAVYLLTVDATGASSADIRTAMRVAVDLLPQLAPDNPRLRYAAAGMASFNFIESGRTCYHTMLIAALDVARQKGSDVYTARCGYQLANEIDWIIDTAVQQGRLPPSAVLGWLLEAEAAHRRCKALLPRLWIIGLGSLRASAVPAKAALQHMQQQGDRWRRLAHAAQQEHDAAIMDVCDEYKDPGLAQATAYVQWVRQMGDAAPRMRSMQGGAVLQVSGGLDVPVRGGT